MDMNRGLSEKELEMVCGGSKVNDLASEAATAIKDIGVEIAARICATTEALNAGMEVRITIQENTLKGTEVFITKNGKEIGIRFVTCDTQSADILNQRSGELRSQLMGSLKDIDYVEVIT